MKHKLTEQEKEELERISRIVAGSLRDTIYAHGPITKEFVGSATKRISNQLFNDLRLDQKSDQR